jgi:hypothetical protein
VIGLIDLSSNVEIAIWSVVAVSTLVVIIVLVRGAGAPRIKTPDDDWKP